MKLGQITNKQTNKQSARFVLPYALIPVTIDNKVKTGVISRNMFG